MKLLHLQNLYLQIIKDNEVMFVQQD